MPKLKWKEPQDGCNRMVESEDEQYAVWFVTGLCGKGDHWKAGFKQTGEYEPYNERFPTDTAALDFVKKLKR